MSFSHCSNRTFDRIKYMEYIITYFRRYDNYIMTRKSRKSGSLAVRTHAILQNRYQDLKRRWIVTQTLTLCLPLPMSQFSQSTKQCHHLKKMWLCVKERKKKGGGVRIQAKIAVNNEI